MGATENFFKEQLEALEAFLLDPKHAVLRLVIDPEMRRMPLKYLGCRDDQDDFPHLLLTFTRDFDGPHNWFARLLEWFDDEIERNRETLDDVGANYQTYKTADRGTAKPWEIFHRRAEILAESLPDDAGSLVFILEADEVGDPANFANGIRYLAERTTSKWLKFIVLEPRLNPVLEDLADHPDVRTQAFWLSPDEIERMAKADLAGGGSSGAAAKGSDGGKGTPSEEQRRALTTIGLMAYTRKDYDEAEEAQVKAVKAAKEVKDPVETALALYNLANTYIAAERYEEAVEVLLQTADGCAYHKLDDLAPMVYTNLGVALFHAGEPDPAVKSMKVARDMFQSAGNIPGEAHVCDCLALLYHESDDRAQAEKAWNFALSLYDRIKAPEMEDVRDGGREAIIQKMDHFGYSHG